MKPKAKRPDYWTTNDMTRLRDVMDAKQRGWQRCADEGHPTYPHHPGGGCYCGAVQRGEAKGAPGKRSQ